MADGYDTPHVPPNAPTEELLPARGGMGVVYAALGCKGYFAVPTPSGRPQFAALRSDPAFRALLEEAEAGRRRALAAFLEAGGERLIGA